MTQEIRANNINILPSCHDCLADHLKSSDDCKRLIREGLCRFIVWLKWRGLWWVAEEK